MSLEEYTEFLVKGIVMEPDMVKIQLLDDELNILVPEDQMKFLIGKSAKNLLSLKRIINAYITLNKLKNVKINVEAF